MTPIGYQARSDARDNVTPELRRQVLEADEYQCVAPRVDDLADRCRNRWGSYLEPGAIHNDDLTLDHVKDQPKVGDPIEKRRASRRRAPSDMAHLVTLCWHHHLDGWATSHRPGLRAYIAERERRRAQQDGQAHTDA